jgi:4-amino-4-deoxy-L-arabinose transferase-like glycosyltransferase
MTFTLLITLAVSAWLRFYNNTAIALWHDEAFSALYTRDYSFMEMMHRIGLDVHPPLYYLVLKIWSMIFGSSLLSLRGLSILLGVLTVWAGYLLVKYAFKSKKLGVLTAVLLAINPFQIQYALEARMYTLGTFLVLISSYFLLKALYEDKKKYWIWYALTAAGCLYTHYFVFFSVAAQVLFAFYYIYSSGGSLGGFFKNPQLRKFVYSGLLMILLYLPWLPTFIVQNRRVQENYWIPGMDRWSVPGTVWKMLFGGEGINHKALILTVAAVLILIWYFLAKVKEKEKWLIFLMLVGPFVGSILFSLSSTIYLDRYFVFASLFLVILISISFNQINRFAVRRLLIAVFIIASLAAFFKNWKDLNIDNKPGMAKAAEYINDHATKEDKIYVGSSFVFFTFKYYNETGIKPLLYSSGSLDTIPHFSGTALLTDEDLILNFNQAAKDDTVWLLWTTGFGGNKPNVPGSWRIVVDREFEDVPGFKGKIIITQYHVN